MRFEYVVLLWTMSVAATNQRELVSLLGYLRHMYEQSAEPENDLNFRAVFPRNGDVQRRVRAEKLFRRFSAAHAEVRSLRASLQDACLEDRTELSLILLHALGGKAATYTNVRDYLEAQKLVNRKRKGRLKRPL